MSGQSVDFGRSADDYARHRPGFPPEFFERMAALGLGRAGQQVVDLGTGTGTLARGFAARGARAVGLDRSAEMLAAAAGLDATASPAPGAGRSAVVPSFVRARAEATPVRDASVDLVCAGQCWHWFDRPAAAAEVARILAPGGCAAIAFFSYLADPGSLGAATEALVLRYQPGWEWAGKSGRYPEFFSDLGAAGLRFGGAIDFDLDVPFSHAAWRGRFRACNGVLTLPEERIAAFDRDLAGLLAAGYPEPLVVPHRVYAFLARKPGA
jgi:SAM-dependent methyltransferase